MYGDEQWDICVTSFYIQSIQFRTTLNIVSKVWIPLRLTINWKMKNKLSKAWVLYSFWRNIYLLLKKKRFLSTVPCTIFSVCSVYIIVNQFIIKKSSKYQNNLKQIKYGIFKQHIILLLILIIYADSILNTNKVSQAKRDVRHFSLIDKYHLLN